MKINIFSLPTVIVINWLILVFVVLFPSDVYQQVIDEPYFASLHGEMFVYITLSLGLMWLGWIIVEPAHYSPQVMSPIYPPSFLWLLRGMGFITPFIYALRLFSSSEVQEALSSQLTMNEVRDLISEMSINYLVQLAMVSSILCIYLAANNRALRSIIDVVIVAIMISCLFITMQRSLLMPYILTIGVAYYQGQKQMTLLQTVFYGGCALLSGLSLFLLIAALRQQEDVSLLQSILGYTVASYNRLAVMLDGNLQLPDSGTGYYTLQWLYYPPVVRDILHIPDLASSVLGTHLPITRADNYYAQFEAIEKTPLAANFIWTTFFGTVYSDYGWLSLFFYVVFGACCQAAYISMQKRQLLGIFLYCYIYATSLLWFGDGFIFQSTTLLICYMAVFYQLIAILFRYTTSFNEQHVTQ